jgi:hypothetical protein
MTISTGSRHSLYYIEEATRGTTPATPAWQELRHTGASLALTKEVLESGEIRSDRQIVDVRHGNKQVGGDINSEFSYTTYDALLEALLGSSFATDGGGAGIDRLEVGTDRTYFSIMREFSDITNFHVATGCEINTLALNIAPNQIVTSDWGIIGDDQTASGTAPAGSTYVAPTTTDPMDSFTGTITEGGGSIGVVTSLTVNVDNGIEALFAVGSDTIVDTGIGRSNVTGTLEVYFESQTLLDKFWNETESSVVFELTDPAGNKQTWTLPRVKYTGGQPDVSGEGPITISMPFQALYDTTEQTNLRIDRDPV